MQILIRIFAQICTKLWFYVIFIRILVQICTEIRLDSILILRGDKVYNAQGALVK